MNREIIYRDGRKIADDVAPYIIAEVNSSHNGDINLAKRMAFEAKGCGCDCVKFQSWSTDSLYSRSYYNNNPIAKRIVKKMSLSLEEQKELADYCKEIGIAFSSTPYSKEEVDFLNKECGVPFIKISSMELNNWEYLKYIGETGCPIILSTGMGDTEEIIKAVDVIESTGNSKLCLLHCISIYPTEAEKINLNNIIGLREQFPKFPIGFSDHSLGIELSMAAIALGARIIEKHFTLDKCRIGMDNNMAIEPHEMRQLVNGCHNVYKSLGNKQRIVSQEEYEQRKKMRRSLVTTRDLLQGEIIQEQDIDAKRPGDGFSPLDKEKIVGRRVIKEIKKDEMILKEHIEM